MISSADGFTYPTNETEAMTRIELDGTSLSLADIETFLSAGDVEIKATDEARRAVKESAKFCESIASGDDAHYGINTGFGLLANKRIPKDSLADLQRNLLRSHATGMGPDLPEDIVRLMMTLRVNSLLRGYSGVSLDVIEYLQAFVNRRVTPAVPCYGSVGASGDLAPLAHMALPLIGEGRAYWEGSRVCGGDALLGVGLAPLKLKPKEGLALINGTQMMSAFAVRELVRTKTLIKASMIASSMSVEAYEATDRVFDERIHKLKNHPGQQRVAAGYRRLLQDSKIVESHRDCSKVQDPYSFRCIPQVLGAVVDTVFWVEEWATREINSVTDNPLLFEDDGEVLSGGNFHGEHMAMALDALGIAVAELGSIAERRIDKLLDNNSDKLPQFLIGDPGLNSGLMVTQYLAAALVSENKVHAHPAVVDSIPTSASFEDHVSMGSISALKLVKIVDNVTRITAIELLAGAQAMDYFAPLAGGRGSQAAFEAVREQVSFLERDAELTDDLRKLRSIVEDGSLVRRVESVTGDLLSAGKES